MVSVPVSVSYGKAFDVAALTMQGCSRRLFELTLVEQFLRNVV